MKKRTASLLLILACITMCACGKQDKTDEKSQVDLYVDVLQTYLSEGKTDFSVLFINVNDDDIKEMVVILGDTEMDGGYLYTIKDGEAVQLSAQDQDYFGQYGGFTYLEKGNVFIHEFESITDSQISNSTAYYSMENGEVVCKDTTESVSGFDSDESTYYVNGQQVESKEFDSIEEKYCLSSMSTVKYSEGICVVDNQMDEIYKAYDSEK